MSNIAWREPEIFAAGDTLVFQRYLPDYLPDDGWSLHYVLTDPVGGVQLLTFDSATSADDETVHAVNVANFAATIPQGDYILTGQVVNATTGEKHQIYYAELSLQPDLAAGTAGGPILTTAQKMIQSLESILADLYKQKFQETDVQRSRFVAKKTSEVLKDLQYWYEKRANEVNLEAIRGGGGNMNDFTPIFRG